MQDRPQTHKLFLFSPLERRNSAEFAPETPSQKRLGHFSQLLVREIKWMEISKGDLSLSLCLNALSWPDSFSANAVVYSGSSAVVLPWPAWRLHWNQTPLLLFSFSLTALFCSSRGDEAMHRVFHSLLGFIQSSSSGWHGPIPDKLTLSFSLKLTFPFRAVLQWFTGQS